MALVERLLQVPFRYHLLAGALIRYLLILYADYHDGVFDVPYTDVDYTVFSDAARHVFNKKSPYNRHTYRYSPLLAYLLIPTVLNKNYGKILFSIFDILIAAAVKCIIEQHTVLRNRDTADRVAVLSSLFWLYNPLSIVISTRGNADSISCFLIILAVLYLQTEVVKDNQKYSKAGMLLATAIHLRLYPIVFCFPMYLSLGEYRITRNTSIKDGLRSLIPNNKQAMLTFSCLSYLILVTAIWYSVYGYESLFETYIYHLLRKDIKHNFSVSFYYNYLTSDQFGFDIVKYLTQIFECVILFVLSLTFGCDVQTLPFALFCQAVVLVAFNNVMTSQYFVWFLSLLPLVITDFKMGSVKAFLLVTLWVFGQSSWLFYGYLLEFKCKEVFLLIWLKGILFFCVNVFVLGQIIKSYTPNYGFGFTNDANKQD